MNSLHLHVVDMDYAGPSFNAQKWHGRRELHQVAEV